MTAPPDGFGHSEIALFKGLVREATGELPLAIHKTDGVVEIVVRHTSAGARSRGRPLKKSIAHQLARHGIDEVLGIRSVVIRRHHELAHEHDPALAAQTYDHGAQRAERRLRMVGELLPTAIRDRQVLEWLDEVESEREAGGNPSRVVRSILLRSVIPIAITGRARLLGRAFARPG
jgi:hypothetical protein